MMAVAPSALPARPAATPTAWELLRHAAERSRRWLRADLDQAIRIEPARSRRHLAAGPDAELRVSLLAWASMLRRRRALVVVRRHLIAALGLAIAAELVLVLSGGDRQAPWLLAPFAIALLDGALALSRPVGPDTAAQMLDRRLGLHDLLSTASSILREPQQPLGLAALVVEEGQAAAADSFATVAPTATWRGREWASLAAGAVVLALLVAVPGSGGARAKRHEVTPIARAPIASPAHAHAKPSASSRAAQRERAAGAPGTLARPPLAVTTNGSRQSKGSGFSPYGHGAASFSAKQLARQGIASPPANTKALGALAVGEAGGGGASSAASSAGSHAGGTGGKPNAGSGAGASAAQGASASSGAGALSPAGTQGHSAGALDASGSKQAGVGAGSASSGASPPGGNAAGSAAGSTALRSGLVPVLGGGDAGLPLQAGYAPSSTPRSAGGEGVSQTPNGGGRGGRSAHATAGGSGSVSSNVSVIPPTFNSTSTLEQGVLSGYFGAANQLTPSNW
jgi:hypothetical protein